MDITYFDCGGLPIDLPCELVVFLLRGKGEKENMFRKVLEYIKKPGKLYAYLAFKGCFNYLNDKKYCEMLFQAETGRIAQPWRF